MVRFSNPLLNEGLLIQADFLLVSDTGSAKFQLADWDRDGKTDLLVGAPQHGLLPEPQRGVPWIMNHRGGAVLLLRNIGSNEHPKFEYPAVMHIDGKPNIIVGTERRKMVFFHGSDIEWRTIK